MRRNTFGEVVCYIETETVAELDAIIKELKI
jgi:hypothetical protein